MQWKVSEHILSEREVTRRRGNAVVALMWLLLECSFLNVMFWRKLQGACGIYSSCFSLVTKVVEIDTPQNWEFVNTIITAKLGHG